MSSQSLYRKWRSRSFEDILGQGPIVATLRNAVKHDHVSHAYLFTGPRGTGKTSTARILAKAVNCLAPQDGNPCGQCRMCVAIADGSSPDVIEIDGASNNSIDDIRGLRERVAFVPAEARFKVYVIDEIHRLSGSAFDGLLKTLEEPPQHVLFIFASTEPHKVPETILSRCQRFDFHRIDRESTISRLREVSREEGIELTDTAMDLIAQQSAGSLRDALGILDQVRVFGGNVVDEDAVRNSVGIGRPAIVSSLGQHIIDGNAGAALAQLHDAVGHGVDPRSLSRQLIDYWRGLLLAVNGSESDLDIDPALREPIRAQAARISNAGCLAVLRALTEQVVEPRLNVDPQLPVEMGIVQAILLLHDAGAAAGGSVEVAGPRDTRVPTDQDSRPRGSRPRSSPSVPVETGAEPFYSPPPADAPLAAVAESRRPEDTEVSDRSSAESLESPSRSDSGAPPTAGVEEAWPAVLEAVRQKSRIVERALRRGRLMDVSERELTVGFVYPYERDEVDKIRNRQLVESAIHEIAGSKVRLRCVTDSARPRQPASADTADDLDTFMREAKMALLAVHHAELNATKSRR